jgi:hypothetical protein
MKSRLLIMALLVLMSGPFDRSTLGAGDALRLFTTPSAIAALARRSDAPPGMPYIVVGMTAGEVAGLPAVALRRAAVHIFASGAGRPLAMPDADTGFAQLLQLVGSGEIAVDFERQPLANVDAAWSSAATGRRIVFVP